jgi:hypothetical protein
MEARGLNYGDFQKHLGLVFSMKVVQKKSGCGCSRSQK